MKCKYKNYNKKCETRGIKFKDRECFLVHIKFKDNLIKYKYLCCDKHHQKKLDENLKKGFFNAYNFSAHDINKFILLLWKSIYPYNYMDDLKNIQWNVVAWESRYSQSPKDGTYYLCRLHAQKMSL